MSKSAWTRAEYALLLRAWLDVLEQDAADNNAIATNDKSKTSKDESKSKAAVGARVYERFSELTDDKSRRSLNATTLQRAVLSFNFGFILQYNQAHGANAWGSLSREQREQIYNREKTTSYYFVDLDPGMIASLTAIRKHIASESAKAAAASGYGAKPPPRKAPKKRSPKPKTTTGKGREVSRAIIDGKGSDEDEERSSSDSSSDSLSDAQVKNKKRKKKIHRTKPVKHSKSDQTVLIDALDSLKKEVRHMEKVILRDSEKKTKHPQGSKVPHICRY